MVSTDLELRFDDTSPVKSLESNRVGELATFVFGAVWNEQMASDHLGNAGCLFVVSRRLLNARWRPGPRLNVHFDQDRLRIGSIASIDSVNEALHRVIDTRSAKAFEGDFSSRALLRD